MYVPSLTFRVADVNRRPEERELSVELTNAAKDFVVEGGYEPMYGAKTTETLLAEECRDISCKTDPCRRCGTWRHDLDRCEGR